MKPISEYMTRAIERIAIDTSLLDAVRLMREKGIGSVLVFDNDDALIGIFTERDLLNKVDFTDPTELISIKISDVMTKNVKFVEHDKPYTEVIRIMQNNNVRHMPILRNGQIIGIVSLRDLMRRYEENLEWILEQKQTQLIQNAEELKLANQDLKKNEEALRELIRDKDLTQKKLKDTQEQLVQSEKMATVGNLAAGIAHEIKNPLGIILQGMERIEKNLRAAGDEKTLPFIDMIKRATDRANKVVYTLLKYSRSAHLDIQPVDLYKTIDQSIEVVKNNAKLNNVEIEKNYNQSEQKVINCDSIMLQHVFVDLFTNAIQAMPEGGKITVNVDFKPSDGPDHEDGLYMIEIIDTGVGIDKKTLAKIFDPFYTTKDGEGGTGLGLSTVYLILEQHRGSISVESEPNKGTKFSVKLPAGVGWISNKNGGP